MTYILAAFIAGTTFAVADPSTKGGQSASTRSQSQSSLIFGFGKLHQSDGPLKIVVRESQPARDWLDGFLLNEGWQRSWIITEKDGELRVDVDLVPHARRPINRASACTANPGEPVLALLGEDAPFAALCWDVRLELTSSKPRVTVGEPILLTMRLINDSAGWIYYDDACARAHYPLSVRNQRGQGITNTKGLRSTIDGYRPLAPGSSIYIYADDDIGSYFNFSAPGRYTILFPCGVMSILRVTRPEGEQSAPAHHPYERSPLDSEVGSNILCIQVVDR